MPHPSTQQTRWESLDSGETRPEEVPSVESPETRAFDYFDEARRAELPAPVSEDWVSIAAFDAPARIAEIESGLERVGELTGEIDEGLGDLWTCIGIATVLQPMKESPSESISPEQEKALHDAFAKLSWIDQGKLYEILHTDGTVDHAGLERVYDANRGFFAVRMTDTRRAVEKRDGVLSEAGQKFNGLREEEREPYLSQQLDTLRVEASGQADRMPEPIRFQKGEDATDAILTGIMGPRLESGLIRTRSSAFSLRSSPTARLTLTFTCLIQRSSPPKPHRPPPLQTAGATPRRRSGDDEPVRAEEYLLTTRGDLRAYEERPRPNVVRVDEHPVSLVFGEILRRRVRGCGGG
jgi:hypothetical protein